MPGSSLSSLGFTCALLFTDVKKSLFFPLHGMEYFVFSIPLYLGPELAVAVRKQAIDWIWE
jgi:hypothetical protein